jgi:hypothetical protein
MNLKKERVALLQSRPKSLIQKRRKKKKKKVKIFNRFVRREKIEVEKKTRALMYSNS